jgi:ATP-dependent protease HslVU (ClpYQ) peptidase subunit
MLYSGDEKRHNNPNLAYVDANFIRGGSRATANLQTLLTDFSEKADQLKENVTTVYVISEDKDYRLKSIAQINSLAGWAPVNANIDLSGKADKIYVDQQHTTESTARQTADNNLQLQITTNTSAISQETIDRQTADTNLLATINSGDNYVLATAKTYTDNHTAQATEQTSGTAKIATSTVLQDDTTTDDNTMVTPKKWWTAITKLLSTNRIVSGVWTFVDSIRFGSSGLYASITRSPASNALTLKNNVFEAGAIGKAIILNGTNQRGTFPDIPITFSAISISVWFKTTANANGILVKIGGNGGASYYVGVSAFAGIRINDSAGSQGIGSVNYIDGKWHHLVAASNGSITNLYVDKVLIGTKSGGLSIAQLGTNSIGTIWTGSSGSAWFNGSIDQIIIYSRQLTFNEVRDIYKDGAGVAEPPPGYIAKWEFDEGSGTSSADSSGNGRNVTLVNSIAWTNNGKVPTGGAASEANVFSSVDGLTNGERGQQTFGDSSGGNIQQGKAFRVLINGFYPIWVDNFGKVLVNPLNDGVVEGNGSVASAYLHLGGGKNTAGDAALKFTPGTLLTIPEPGAWEFDGSNLYFSIGLNRIKINANLQSLTDQGNTTSNDIEITSSNKGLILKDSSDGTRRRLTLTNGILNLSSQL